MTTYSWSDVKPFLLGGYDLAGTGETTMEITIPSFERDTEDTTGIGGSGWETSKLTGTFKAGGNCEFTAFYDNSAGNTAAGVYSNVGDDGTQRVVVIGYEGGTAGTHFCGVYGWQVGKVVTLAKAVLTKIKATIKPSGRVDDTGIVLKALAAITHADGTSDAAYVDGAAASAAGGRAYFVRTAFTKGSATNLALSVTDSADHITFGSLVDATAITTGIGAEVKEVSGEVLQYLSSAWTWTGGGQEGVSAATIFIGFQRY